MKFLADEFKDISTRQDLADYCNERLEQWLKSATVVYEMEIPNQWGTSTFVIEKMKRQARLVDIRPVEHSGVGDKQKIKHRYVFYNYKRDMFCVHLGPKVIDFDDDGVHFWPHQVDYGGSIGWLDDKDFRDEHAYVGEL